MRVVKDRNKLAREIVGSPPLEIFKTQLVMVLGTLLWLKPLEQGGVGQVIFGEPFQPQSSCDPLQQFLEHYMLSALTNFGKPDFSLR